MKQAENGSTIKVHYTGKLDDGTVFDSSREREPLEFTVGDGGLIKGFEDAVRGMAVGDTKTIRIPGDEAYGAYRDDLVLNVKKAQFPPDIEPEEGVILCLRRPDGGSIDARITTVSADSVTLDANHPLAGKDLTFDLEMVEIM
ncbi:MAG: FKBP-type peptidyl-prolyl cis-trans isomerase [Dissulfurispiraceae bacterium]|jgi:peptidylprolyl isomerase